MGQLGHQLIRNIFSSWAGYVVSVVIAFVFIPYITSTLGDARYGVWVIIFQTVNYFALMDLGLERALTRYLSKFLGRKDFDAVNRVLNTSTLLYFGIGLIVIAGVFLTAIFLFQYFRISTPEMAEEGRKALMVVGVFVGVRFMLAPFGGSLGGFQRYDIVNGLSMVEEIIRFGALIWLLSQGYGLVALAVAIFAVALARQLVAIIWLKKLFPQVRFSPTTADRATAGMLFRYSSISFGITAAWLVIFGSDSIILGLLASTAAAGIFAPAAQLMLYMRIVVNTVGNPLTPAVSHLEAIGDTEGVRQVYLKGVRYVSSASFFMASGIIIYARPFVHLWLAPEFIESAEVMMILAVGMAVFLPQIIGNSILFGIEQHKFLLRVLLIEAAAKLILSFALIGPYGLLGMALATAIPQVILYSTLYPYLIAKVLGVPFSQFALHSMKGAVIALSSTIPVALVIRALVPPGGWPTFAVNIGLVTLAAVATFMLTSDPADRKRFLGYISPTR